MLCSAELQSDLGAGLMLYHFYGFELDDRLYQLRRASKPIKLEPKVFDVLAYLLHHRDRIVSKDELLDKLWPGQVVSETALTRCIAAARKAVRDDGIKQKVIETQHGRGYRFIAAVTEEAEEPQAPAADTKALPASSLPLFSSSPTGTAEDRRVGTAHPTQLPSSGGIEPPGHPVLQWSLSRRSLMLVGVLLLVGIIVTVQYLSFRPLAPSTVTPLEQAQALPLPDKPSLAVLPLKNLSGDPEQEHFSDGLTEDLITDLSKIAGLFIISRNTVFTYKGKAVKTPEISKELGVRYVLEGSVRKVGDQVRVTMRLIDAATDSQLWAERYDRSLKDIFALQDEIRQKIVTTLKLQVTLMEQGYQVRKRTDNLEAYDYYLRGMVFFWRITKEANLQARQMYEKALALDPQYAEAYACLGWTYFLEWFWRWGPDPQNLERAFDLIQRAIALDDTLPNAHTMLGPVYLQKKQFDQALASVERALAIDPNMADTYVWRAGILNTTGRSEEALRSVETALRLNPRYPFWYLGPLGFTYRAMDRYEEAITAFKTLLTRNPDFVPAYAQLAICYLLQWGSQRSQDPQILEQALMISQKAIALNDFAPWSHATLGYVYAYQKQYELAMAEIERAIALEPNFAWGYAVQADMLSFVNRPEEAIGLVEKAMRLDPPPYADEYSLSLGLADYLAGRDEEAIAPLKRFLTRHPNRLQAHLILAAVYSELGREAEARAEAAEVLRINPNFSLEIHRQRDPAKDPVILERTIAALRKAGLQ
jgi:TolB-like protein/DNA-binding winged helix-turn-helix (wHTH) protein/Flp pilus assembly protein TadD